jgi:O-glycosyl hydrolase
MVMIRKSIFYCQIFFVCCLLSSLQAQERHLSIDVKEVYQTIDNFGASDCWSMQKVGEWAPTQKERIADLLFSTETGIGLSAWRFNIGAGINFTTIRHPWRTVETFEVAQDEYDWSRQEEERWFLQAAKERGVEQFIAFVNSPPARMTRNGYTNCTDGMGSTNLNNGYEAQFAKYLVDILKHFRDAWSIHFNYISPVNEPQWEWNDGSNQEGNRASNDDLKAISLALYAELERQGVETAIQIMESGDLKSWYQELLHLENEYGKKYGNYLSNIVNDPELSDKIKPIFCGHSYWSDRISNQLVQDREFLALHFQPFFDNGWKYWMTEYAILDGPDGAGGRGRDLTIKTALDVARVIHYDLTLLNASAWQWWTAVSPEDYKDGLIYTDYMNDPTNQNIIESKLLWAVGNYSRFIRPGSKRVSISGAEDKHGLMGSAFLSPDEENLILVFVNIGFESQSIFMEFPTLDYPNNVKTFTPYITSDEAGDDLNEYSRINADSVYTIPPRSVVTLVGEIRDTTGTGTEPEYDPETYTLFQNFPNPFNHRTDFYYHLPESGRVQISIYSTSGEKIKSLLDTSINSGLHSISWDGTNDNNLVVGSGIYFYVLQAGNFRDQKKMVFTK